VKTLSVSEAKMKLSGLVNAVHATDEEVLITRNGSPVAVLISPDELDSLRETSIVRSDAALMAEIKHGLKQLRSKKARLYSLQELVGD
jgi:antitoxin YefM